MNKKIVRERESEGEESFEFTAFLESNNIMNMEWRTPF